RTNRWRYIEWGNQGDKGTELYDQLLDPTEMNNLANSNEYSKTIQQLRKLVHQNWATK
ncbi:MAG: DUF4976 domain-containing protein, partial [Opitutales bacterium]|nr:DUF4976 domain-containing protein [Opitutales bacterium]